MAGGAADERQMCVVPSLEMASLPIPDELVAEIFLRLPTPTDLVRASAACPSFRSVAADRSFLRRYRKLHAPPLLGFVDRRKVLYPATKPGSALALATDFSYSFLPGPASAWVVEDIRNGRVLLRSLMPVQNSTVVFFPEVVVCDPLHRRYLQLPPIPQDLAASVVLSFLTRKKTLRVQNFLLPTCDGEEADETSFRVICMAPSKTSLAAFVFSSNTGQWGAIPSRRWSDLSAELTAMNRLCSHSYACGPFYFSTSTDSEESILLVLDIKTMEFSIAKLPLEANGCCGFAMVEAGEGRPGMLLLAENGSDLSYLIRQDDGGSSSQWQKVKTISLDLVDFIWNTEKYPLLCLREGCFTLDIKTFQLEKVCTLGPSYDSVHLHAYSNFPPSLLSSPTISSGVEKGPDKEMPEQGCAASSSKQSPRPE